MINHDSEQGVFATITSDNDILKKFAIHNLKKYTESSLDFFEFPYVHITKNRVAKKFMVFCE